MSEEVKQEGDFKIKSKPKMKNLGKKNETTKVDLSANKKVEDEITKVNLKQEDANKEQETTAVVADKPAETVQEVVAEIPSGEDPIQDEGVVTIQEITEEEKEEVKDISKEMSEAVRDSNITGKPLP